MMIPVLLLAGCAQNKNVVTIKSDGVTGEPIANVQPAGMIPKASAFRMSGDYANHVAVTFGANGELIYYPAPSDITKSSQPVSLGNGWWLNTQGISANSVFTKWTFDEYKELKNVPTAEEIREAVIPGARVTEMRKLNFGINEARSHIDEIKAMLE